MITKINNLIDQKSINIDVFKFNNKIISIDIMQINKVKIFIDQYKPYLKFIQNILK